MLEIYRTFIFCACRFHFSPYNNILTRTFFNKLTLFVAYNTCVDITISEEYAIAQQKACKEGKYVEGSRSLYAEGLLGYKHVKILCCV